MALEQLASLPLIVSRENFQVAFNVLDIKIALGLIFFACLNGYSEGGGGRRSFKSGFIYILRVMGGYIK